MGPGGWFHEIDPPNRYRLKSGPLKGWMLHRQVGEQLDGIVEFIKNNVAEEDSFLILSDRQIIYSLSGRESYRGVPFHWFVGTIPAPGKQWIVVHNRIVQNPPDWILTYRDDEKVHPINKLFAYLQFPDPLLAQYVLVKYWNDHAILKRVNNS